MEKEIPSLGSLWLYESTVFSIEELCLSLAEKPEIYRSRL